MRWLCGTAKTYRVRANDGLLIPLSYKIARISRSLMDFASHLTLFDEQNVSLVSVSQDSAVRRTPFPADTTLYPQPYFFPKKHCNWKLPLSRPYRA